ncbi:DUF4214 domain-containing protein [Pseudoduganella namucuonensis]|uniref:DUF4214 domain-containing protein n=1 Tax=Pseudoduganella namucuonensis TaxID=1035707 RepID=UPI0015A5F040|nr:DUF4214 domain-containing protein [Pseudoduganella namucuonensis]
MLLLALAGCGAGDQAGQTPAPGTAAQGGTVPARQGAVAFAATFAGNYSQYTIAGNPDGTYTITDIVGGALRHVAPNSRLRFADSAVGLDLDGNAGKIFRLYQATFNRKPDIAGLGYHLETLDNGALLHDVATSFIASKEFSDLYGALNNRAYVTQLYRNVLQREPDEPGVLYHVGYLEGTHPDGIKLSRAQTLLNFSDSPENKDLVLPSIRNGIEYLPWGSSLPAHPVSAYAAQYDGSLRGGDSGNLSIVVNASGALQASGRLTGAAVDVAGSTTLADGGRFEVTLTGTNLSMVVKGSIDLATGVATGGWTNSALGQSGVFNAAKPVVQPSLFPQVQTIVTQRCVPCHSVRPTQPGFNTAPLGITFDTEAQIRSRSASIFGAAVQSQSMPLGNVTGMTQAERDVLAAWFAAGTP